MTKTTGIVVYTDGSARPNPGPNGSGLHGYVYEPAEKFSKAGKWFITDKGYLTDKDVEKTGAKPVLPTLYLDCYLPYPDYSTNNRAEILAPCLLFERYPDLIAGTSEIYVISDSRLMIDGITSWVDKWRRGNWVTSSGQPVKNQEAWMRLDHHVRSFKEHGTITFQWVKGHDEDYGNTHADYLAALGTLTAAARSTTPYVQAVAAQGYHKTDVDFCDLLSLKRIYFNSDNQYNTPGVYYQAGWSGNDFIVGKRVGDSYFSVVMLDEPDPLLEAIMEHQTENSLESNAAMYLKLDRLRNQMVYRYLKEHGVAALTPDRRNLNLNFLDNKPLTFEVKPGELPLRAFDALEELEEFLLRVKEGALKAGADPLGALRIELHPITHCFYQTEAKKKGKEVIEQLVLDPKLLPGVVEREVCFTANTSTSPREFKRKLLFNEDLPNRNVLKRIEGAQPVLHLLTWQESEKCIRYATVVEADGMRAIWSSHFSNFIYFE